MNPDDDTLFMAPDRQRTVHARLVDGYRQSAREGHEARWRWLMAAHVVGQADLRLHLHSHLLMLVLAVRQYDWREAAGQLFRLALVPLGHAAGRLPAGNTGRATVSAFRSMRLEPALRELITDARRRSLQTAGSPPAGGKR